MAETGKNPDPEPDPKAPPRNPFEGDLSALLGDDKFFAANRDERDVSIVYIDRRSQVFNTSEAAAGAHHGGREAVVTQRIGDVVLSSLRADIVAGVVSTFVPPTCFTRAEQVFRQHGVVLLCGPARSGKRSAAIRLLSSIQFDANATPAVYELNPDLRLADLRPSDVPANTPLLLETPDGSALDSMTAFKWKDLVDQLGPDHRNNGLVLTVERLPERLPDEFRRLLVVAWDVGWPGERAAVQWNILHRHLSWQAGRAALEVEDLAALVEQWKSHQGLAGLVSQRLLPGQLAELAELLLPVLNGDCTLDEALARQDRRVAEDVERWYAASNQPLDRKVFLLAAAVFNGALADEVEGAADKLLDDISPPPATQPASPPPDPFLAGGTRSARLKAVGASLTTTAIQGMHYGSATAVALRLDNAAWQKAVIDYVWSELPNLHESLLAWLELYACQGNQRLRVRAAGAIGALARLNFALIEARILRQWAGSFDPNARRAAAQVLGIVMWDEQHGAAASGLLRYWATSDNWRYRWTAATACGGLAGLRYPQQTLDLLGRILDVCHDAPILFEPAAQALVNLYISARGEPERRTTLLRTLRQWVERKPRQPAERDRVLDRHRTLLLSFAYLLWPADADPAWRLLVEDMATPESAAQEDGVFLLRAALNFRQWQNEVTARARLHKVVCRLLRDLVEAVAKSRDGELSEALAGVLQALVLASRKADAATGSFDEWDRLRYCAEGWEQLSAEATALQQLLL